jgi:hypothetical protein
VDKSNIRSVRDRVNEQIAKFVNAYNKVNLTQISPK